MERIKNAFSWGDLVALIASLIIGFTGYFLCLPAIPGWGFAILIMVSLIPFAIEAMVYSGGQTVPSASLSLLLLAGMLVSLIVFIGGTPLFHAEAYANSITVNEEDAPIVTVIPTIENDDDVVLMDSDSAKMLMERAFGGMEKYVGQYCLGDVRTIVFKGKIYKIAALEYNGFFKWAENASIPGYIICDPATKKANFVAVEAGIKYAPSAYFGEDLERHIRSEYPEVKFYGINNTEEFGINAHFQLSEEGTPFWAVPYGEYAVWGGAKTVAGVILVNACDGSMAKYSLGEIPAWVDNAVDGDAATALYNRYGYYKNGAINMADVGRTAVTDDFGYIKKDGVIHVYTGVTSIAGDESNIGFVMVNTNTGAFTYYRATASSEETAAEEYSAMSAAEGVVQNFGYKSSFPTLVRVGDKPTYAMVLKDNQGIIKKYALVDMADINQVSVSDTLDECVAEYLNKTSQAPKPEANEVATKTVTVAAIQFAVIDGNSVAYITTTDGLLLKQSIKDNELLLVLQVGDVAEVSYIASTTGFSSMVSCTKKSGSQ
jgi:hypothetical protein